LPGGTTKPASIRVASAGAVINNASINIKSFYDVLNLDVEAESVLNLDVEAEPVLNLNYEADRVDDVLDVNIEVIPIYDINFEAEVNLESDIDQDPTEESNDGCSSD
jgi:hypothetical protein